MSRLPAPIRCNAVAVGISMCWLNTEKTAGCWIKEVTKFCSIRGSGHVTLWFDLEMLDFRH